MNREIIAEAVGNISIRHVQEAGCYTAAKKPAGILKGAWGKIAAAAALLCVAGLCIPAIAGSAEGFYKDLVRWWDGAVVGTEYENATNEIKIEAFPAVAKEGKLMLPVEITFLEMGNKEPYLYLTGGEAALGDYHITDDSGKELYSARGQQEASGALEDGKVTFVQPIDVGILPEGESYTIVVESVYGLQKAEQPLEMKGHWECKFTVGIED